MRLKDLHLLPKFRDSLSYLYVEHCRIEQEARAVALWDAQGKVPVPCASLGLLMLGPGTSITHAAVSTLADNGCLVLWCGEEGVRLYAHGLGMTRSATNFLHQARLWADPAHRLKVVLRLYRLRFGSLWTIPRRYARSGARKGCGCGRPMPGPAGRMGCPGTAAPTSGTPGRRRTR